MKNKLVPLAVFWYAPEAHIARTYLEDQGILTFVFDDNISSTAWHLTGAVGGVRLMIMKDDYEEASSLLRDIHGMNVELIGLMNQQDSEHRSIFDKITSAIMFVLTGFMFVFSGLLVPFYKRKKRRDENV